MATKEELRRRREREDEIDAKIRERLKPPTGKPGGPPGFQEKTPEQLRAEASSASTEKVLELLDRAEPMIQQVNSLYNMFMSGAEKLPPTERRKQLDQLMHQLQLMHKSSAGLQFRYRSVYEQYTTFRDRWDKLMRDLESGKIRRSVRGG